MRPGLFEFHKQATVTLITGRMGAGKTTLAKKLKGEFDEFFQTDLPRPMNHTTGKYDEPTKAEKVEMRAKRLHKILKADDAGKKVLVEGHPPGVRKLFRDHLDRIDRALLIPVSVAESFQRVLRRALRDPKEYNVLTEMDAAVYNNKKFDRDIQELHDAGIKFEEYNGPAVKTAAITSDPTPKAPHLEKLDEHFTTTDGDKWSTFRKNLRAKSFSQAVKQDPRADRKLKRYAANIHQHLISKNIVAKVKGDSGKTYTIKANPDTGRHSCSCGHWINQLSSKSKGDCKHITAHLASQKEKQAGLVGEGVSALGRSALLAHHHEAMARENFQSKAVAEAYKRNFPSNFKQNVGNFVRDTSVLYEGTRH